MFYLTIWLIFIIAFLGTLIIMLIINQSQISNIRKRQEEINLNVEEYLQNNNFNITKRFYLKDNATYNQDKDCKKFIAVDNNSKKLCLINYQKSSMFIVDFKDILNYEIYENGSNSTFGGNIGGFGAGIFAAETNGMCKELKLFIRLKRYDMSQISYEIISNTFFNFGLNKSSQPYRECISTLQEFVSFLEVLKNENKIS